MRIGVLTAMSSEFEQLVRLLEGAVACEKGGVDYMTGRLGGNEIVLRQCGIGKVNAAVGTADYRGVDRRRAEARVAQHAKLDEQRVWTHRRLDLG